jgi:hypothetical protein
MNCSTDPRRRSTSRSVQLPEGDIGGRVLEPVGRATRVLAALEFTG